MATVRTAQYFISKFIDGYSVQGVDMQDLIASIPSIGATDLTTVNAAIAALQLTHGAPNVITQSGAVTIPDFTTSQKLLDICEKIDIVYGDETTPTITYPTNFFPESSNGKTFDANYLNIITEQWIKSIGKTRFWIEKQPLSTPPADTTPATFTIQSISGIGQTAASVNFRINESGLVKYMVTTSSTKPSKTDIGAGTGQVASNHATLTMVANVTNTVSISGLSSTTAYYVHYYSIDSEGNENATVSTLNFTTSSVSDTTNPSIASIATNSTGSQIIFTFDETLGSVTPDASDFGFNLGRDATLVSRSGATITVTVNLPYLSTDSPVSTYTPGTNKIQDAVGNFAAGFVTGQSGVPAITNNATPLVFYDNFNSANSSDITGRTPIVGGAYTSVDVGTSGGANSIFSNQLKCIGGSTVNYKSNVSVISKTDIDFRATVATPPATANKVFFTVSYVDESNRILVNETGQIIQITTAGGGVVLFAGSGSCIAGDQMRVVIAGTTITVYRISSSVQTLLTTQTISSSAKGAKIGFIIQDPTAVIDDIMAY